MAELRFDVLADLKKLTKQIKDELNKKFKINVGAEVRGRATGGAGVGDIPSKGGQDKQTGLLSTIAKSVGILAILSQLKPIIDLLTILTGFVVIGLMKVLTAIKDGIVAFFEPFTEAFETIGNLFSDLKDFLTGEINLEEYLKNTFTTLLEGMFAILNIDDLQNIINEIFNTDFDFIEWVKGKMNDDWDFVWDITEWFITKMTKWGWTWDLTKWIAEQFLGPKGWKFDFDLGQFLKDFMLGRQKPRESLTSPSGLIHPIFSGPPSLGPLMTVGDAIIRPNGQVIKTDPNDTLIASRNPEGMGGGSKTFIFNGIGMDEAMERVKRELYMDTSRAGVRF